MDEIIQVQSVADVAIARELFTEYAASLGITPCFDNFGQELETLPGEYASPRGRLFIALINGEGAGCAAIRPLQAGICEIKRLYVRTQFRGYKLGRTMTKLCITEASNIGYSHMRLETLPDRMQTAVELYRSIGFVEIVPYGNSPKPGTSYMELTL